MKRFLIVMVALFSIMASSFEVAEAQRGRRDFDGRRGDFRRDRDDFRRFGSRRFRGPRRNFGFRRFGGQRFVTVGFDQFGNRIVLDTFTGRTFVRQRAGFGLFFGL